MNIKIFNNFDSELQLLWQKLESKINPFVFQRYRWLEHWNYTIGISQNNQLSIVVLLKDKAPSAIIPLLIENYFGIKVLRFIGGDQCDYNSVLATDIGMNFLRKYKTWEIILSKIINCDVIRLTKITEETLRKLRIKNNNIKIKELKEKCAFTLVLPEEYSEFERHIKRKKDTKRKIKRLKEKGVLRFEHLENNNEKANHVLQILIEQKRASYKRMKTKDILSSNCNRDFYTNMPWNLGENSYIHLTTLWLDKDVIAAHWGAVDGDRFYWLMPTYSPSWSKYSAGRIILEELIKWSINHKLKLFDFTIGEETYKKEWCNKETKLFEICYPVNIKGKIYLLLLKLKKMFVKYSLVFK